MVKQTFSVQLFVQWTTRLMYDDETAAEAAAVVTDAAAVVTAAAAVVIAAAAASHSPESVLLIILFSENLFVVCSILWETWWLFKKPAGLYITSSNK